MLQRYLQRYSAFSAHLVGPDLPPQLLNSSRRPGKGGAAAAGTGVKGASAGAAGAAGVAGAAGSSAARPRLLRNHTILVSSLHRTPDGGEYLPLALAGSGADLGSSLFYAAYSLTEAPPKVRDALRPTLRQFGLLFVTFTDIIQACACACACLHHTQAHAHTHARTHARSHARTHSHTGARTSRTAPHRTTRMPPSPSRPSTTTP